MSKALIAGHDFVVLCVCGLGADFANGFDYFEGRCEVLELLEASAEGEEGALRAEEPERGEHRLGQGGEDKAQQRGRPEPRRQQEERLSLQQLQSPLHHRPRDQAAQQPQNRHPAQHTPQNSPEVQTSDCERLMVIIKLLNGHSLVLNEQLQSKPGIKCLFKHRIYLLKFTGVNSEKTIPNLSFCIHPKCIKYIGIDNLNMQ